MNIAGIASILAAISIAVAMPAAYGETIRQTMEGGMDLEITYPDSIISGREFSVSVLIQNNGWEDKEQVIFGFDSDDAIVTEDAVITVDRITAGSSYGETIDFKATPDASAGIHFLNLDYSQVLLQNNETPQDPDHTNIAIALNVKEQPKIIIRTITPESIFVQAEFPFTVELLSEDIDLKDVRVEIIPPDDIEFRGQTAHTFSSIQKGELLSITSRIITPSEEILTEYKVPFQIVVRYVDDTGEEKEDSKTISLVLRPRTVMELTTDGGIWIGNFFIAPYVSIGTIIGIPAGIIFSLIVRKKTQKSKKKKRSAKERS